ncbi:hypothetical protein JCM10213_007078 [Rhodosporidiobolus nylandii]
MDKPESALLVPDTPTATAQEQTTYNNESASQSLLLHFIGGQPSASSPGPAHERTTTDFHSQGLPLPARRPRRSSVEDDSREVEADLSTVVDSQAPRLQSPTRPKHQADALAKRRARISDETMTTASQPVEGPSGFDDGMLPQTQFGESLDTSMERRRRASAGNTASRVKQDAIEEDKDGEVSVSMELTRAEGGLVDRTEIVEDGSVDPADGEVTPTPSAAQQPSESQKENPSPSRPASNPSAGQPFSLRHSQANCDSSGAPSSSPAVARELLQRSPAKQLEAGSLPTPVSSADPDIPVSELFSPGRKAKRALEAMAELPDLPKVSGATTSSGPSTSTPAFANPPPPQPLATARTVPHMNFPPLPGESPPAIPTASRSHPTISARPSAGIDLIATSAAMKAPLPPPKRQKREPWDGISQSTNESSMKSTQLDTQQESPDLPQTVVHVEEHEADRRSQEPPKPTAERTMDMDLEESGTLNSTIHVGGGGELDNSLGNSSASRTMNPLFRPSSAGDEDSLDLRLKLQPSRSAFPPVASSSPSQESMQRADSQVSLTSGRGRKRLSDIVGSSPQPTQYEVPATQDHDAFSSSTNRTQDVTIDNSEQWHASFENDTSSTRNHSRTISNPPKGRELRRQPPPPTPVRDGLPQDPAHPKPQSSSSSSAITSQPLKHESLAIDPTQLEESFRLPDHPARFHSFPPDPTQSVPESSPEVPLASKRPPPPPHSSRSPSRPPQLSATVSSGQREQQTSSNGVVPDSEGPTQPAADSPRSRAPDASTSAIRQPTIPEREQQVSPDDFYQQQEFGGGFDDDEQMKDASAREEDEEDELPPPAAKGKKGKSKAKEVDGPSRKAPTVKKAIVPSKSGKTASKGKGRALQAEDSPDALDMLSNATSSHRRHVGESAAPTEETNYTSVPTAKNPKKRSPKKTVAPAPAKGKSKGKKAVSEDEGAQGSESELTEPEPEEEEEEPEPPARKKRRTSKAIVEETDAEDEEAEAPLKKARRTSAGKATAAKKEAPAAKAKKGKAAAKEKKVARGRPSKTSSMGSAASRSPEPRQPVAGPSRLRFDSVEQNIPAGAASPTPSRSRSTSAGPAVPKSRLPSSVPFIRCFGMWRDDKFFYPGEIKGVVGGEFDVVFDDDSRGRLKPDEIRRCELQRGDYVRYRGDEFETETQSTTLAEDVLVQRVERGTSGVDTQGELAADDIIVAASTNHDEGRIHRLQVDAVCIPPRRSAQFDNRRLTAEELALFMGKKRPPVVALQLEKPPKPIRVQPFKLNKASSALFGRMAFLVTYGPDSRDNKDKFVDLLVDNGGTVIEWEHLLTVTPGEDDSAPPHVFFPKIDFEEIDEIVLVADRACTTVKYLMALALGIPCLSKHFATLSEAQRTRLPFSRFGITAGFIQELETYGIGTQLEALNKRAFDLDSLQAAYAAGGVFKNSSFLVVSSGKKLKGKDEKDQAHKHLYTFYSLLSAAGASLVHFVASPAEAASAQGYDFVFLEEDRGKDGKAAALPRALAGHKGLVNIVWVKQCLMAGRLLEAARMREVEDR